MYGATSNGSTAMYIGIQWVGWRGKNIPKVGTPNVSSFCTGSHSVKWCVNYFAKYRIVRIEPDTEMKQAEINK